MRYDSTKADELYQKVCVILKERRNNQPWVENPAVTKPKSLYPNVAAEWNGTRISGDSIASCAHISKHILIAVVTDNEPLTLREFIRLSGIFQCRYDYLMSPCLAIVDPSTRKGKVRLHKVSQLLQNFKSPEYYNEQYHAAHKAVDVHNFLLNDKMELASRDLLALHEALTAGTVVTYAWYRNAVNQAEEALAFERNSAILPRVRTRRIVQDE